MAIHRLIVCHAADIIKGGTGEKAGRVKRWDEPRTPGEPSTIISGMHMRALLRLSVVAFLALVVLIGRPRRPGTDGRRDRRRHIAARGGRDKLASIQTVKMTRTVASGIGTTLKVIVYKKRPNLMRVEQGPAQPGATMTPRGINPEAVWDMVQGKAVPRQPQLAAESREVDGDFDGLLVDWREKGHAVTLAGREAMPGGETYKLTMTLKSGLVRTIYLDAKTYLDRRHTGVLNLPNGRRFDVTIDYDNWRDVDGVKFPFDITEERTGKEPVVTLVTYTEKIEINVPMDDGLFARRRTGR